MKTASLLFLLAETWGGLSLTTLGDSPESGWARLCGSNSDGQDISQDIYTKECPARVWFHPENSVRWNCICTMGSFNARFSWCKPDEPITGLGTGGYARFTTNDLTCFNVAPEVSNDQKFHGLLSMHDPSDREQEDFPYIWTKLSGGTLLSRFDLKSEQIRNISVQPGISTLFAIRVNPKVYTYYSIYSPLTKRALCLLPPGTTTTEQSGGFYSYPLKQLWAKSPQTEVFKLELYIKAGCQFRDTRYHFDVVSGNSLGDYVIPKFDRDEAHADCIKCLQVGSPFDAPNTTENCRSNESDASNSQLLHEIDLQSERLAKYWIDYMLHGTAMGDKTEGLQEFVILRKAAIMAYGACNMNHIPRQFFQYFLILFQALIRDSSSRFPPQVPLQMTTFDSILASLTLCMKETKPYDILVDNTTCPRKYTKYMTPGGTNYVPIEVPPELMADPAQHDYVVEFAWKLVTFLHYHCHSYFKESPLLQDLLQTQLEGLFTNDLLQRWLNPSKSLAMLDILFKMQLDVKVAMYNFELCVAVSNRFSAFQGWLKKPINQPLPALKNAVSKRKRDVTTTMKKSAQNNQELLHKESVQNRKDEAKSSAHDDIKEEANTVWIDLPEEKEETKSVLIDLPEENEETKSVLIDLPEEKEETESVLIDLPEEKQDIYIDLPQENISTEKQNNRPVEFTCLQSISELLANPTYSLNIDACFDEIQPSPK